MSAGQLYLLPPPVKTHVGGSLHTPYKHALHDKILGKQIGAATRLPWIEEILYIDACAGSYTANAFSGTSSPQILMKHLAYPFGKPMRCYLIDKNTASVDQLRQHITDPRVTILHGDYRSAEIARIIGPSRDGTVAYIYIDPNHADDVEISSHLRAISPEHTIKLITFGCNASGIKRLPTERRRQWFDRLEYIVSIKPPTHDICLMSLMRDSAQWAYVLSSPIVWRKAYDSIINGVTRMHWTKGVAIHWLSNDVDAFWRAAYRLFLKVDGSETR